MEHSAPGYQQDGEEDLAVPLLVHQQQQEQEEEIHSVGGETAGDIEQGLQRGSEAGTSHKSDDEAAASVVVPGTFGPITYFTEVLRLLIFYAAIVADAFLLKELYSRQYMALAISATVFTGVPHLLMSVLLVVRQGWLQAASQACGFILTLNPFESLSPIPEGVLGLFVLAIGFVAYVLIAASGLIFVAYCVVCYLVTALMFSLLILDLAALVVTCAPTKSVFKYTDLVYTENFKLSRLVLQSWLQSLPQLSMMAWVAATNLAPEGPIYPINSVVFILALVAHFVNVWDKALLFSSAVRATGAGPWWHTLFVLGLRGAVVCSRPVVQENLGRMLRSDFIVHISCYEDPEDVNSEQAASMVPEYLTPTNGGLLAPGQFMAVANAALVRFGGPAITELVLEVSRDVRVGRVLRDACPAFPNLTTVRLTNARIAGTDANMLASALLGCGALRSLQVQSAHVDAQGAAALARFLQGTSTLQSLDLCKCKLRGSAATQLSRGLRTNRTLRTFSCAGTQLEGHAGADVAEAVRCSKALEGVNLAGCKLGQDAVASLAQSLLHSPSLRTLAVSLPELGPNLGAQLVSAVHSHASPKQPLAIECHMALGSFSVTGLERVQFLCVADQDVLLADSWQAIAPGAAANGEAAAPSVLTPSGGTGATSSSSAGGGAFAFDMHPAAAGPGVSGSNEAAAAATAAPVSVQLDSGYAFPRSHAALESHDEDEPTASHDRSNRPHAAALALPLPASEVSSSMSPQQAEPWPRAATPPRSDAGSNNFAPAPPLPAAPAAAAATSPPGPSLVFVMTQEEAMKEVVRLPLYFEALDTLDLTGLGVGCNGAKDAAEVVRSNAHLRRLVLADNGIGQEGASALGEALKSNTQLQVLDLSGNEFDDATVTALADALEGGCIALSELVLLGNKYPFTLPTLRRLMAVERANPQVHLVLVEEPSEAIARSAADPWAQQQAITFYAKQNMQRELRRLRQARKAKHQQMLQQAQQAQEQTAGEGAAAAVAGVQQEGGNGTDAGSSGDDAPAAPACSTTLASDSRASPGAARQAAAAGAVDQAGRPAPSPAPSVVSSGADEDCCGVCFDNENHVAIKYCGHRLCVDCYRQVWEASGGGACCPFCRARLEGYMYLDWPLE